jgi:mono/diheme cytochrome c family protein
MWWYHALLPGGFEDFVAGGQPAVAYAARVLGWVGLGLVLVLLFPIVFPKRLPRIAAFVIAVVGLVGFGAGEWVREAARKPYVIHGYLYPTGLRLDEAVSLASRGGILANAIWVENRVAKADAASGKEVFRVACRGCHTLGGYNGLRDRLAGLDEDYIYELTGRLEILRGLMPPFPGTDVERRAVATYLSTEIDDTAPAGGREVFEKRCGFCHMKEGYRPLIDSMQGYTREDIVDILPLLGDMTDEMTPWSGTEEEANHLADYISKLVSGRDRSRE